jgi:hypothetical protein
MRWIEMSASLSMDEKKSDLEYRQDNFKRGIRTRWTATQIVLEERPQFGQKRGASSDIPYFGFKASGKTDVHGDNRFSCLAVAWLRESCG